MIHLSDKEQVALDLLRQVKGKSIYIDIINEVVNVEDVPVQKFRDLIGTLLSQGNDDHKVMENILGAQCYASILALKK